MVKIRASDWTQWQIGPDWTLLGAVVVVASVVGAVLLVKAVPIAAGAAGLLSIIGLLFPTLSTKASAHCKNQN